MVVIVIHICVFPKLGPGFLMSYVVVLFVLNGLRRAVVVCFNDIGEIVDYHCLNFLFMIQTMYISLFIGIN